MLVKLEWVFLLAQQLDAQGRIRQGYIIAQPKHQRHHVHVQVERLTAVESVLIQDQLLPQHHVLVVLIMMVQIVAHHVQQAFIAQEEHSAIKKATLTEVED